MKRFEYEITKLPADDLTHIVYFCTDEGECNLDQIPSDQTNILVDLFNKRGSEGWELVQLVFGKDGMIIIWKREIPSQEAVRE